jgi:hypothetical protein
LPSYEFSFSKPGNIKEENTLKIGIQNFARSVISENHLIKQIFTFPTNSNVLSNKNESENSNALISQKATKENQKVSLQNSKKENWVLEENRARKVEVMRDYTEALIYDTFSLIPGANIAKKLITVVIAKSSDNVAVFIVKGFDDIVEGEVLAATKRYKTLEKSHFPNHNRALDISGYPFFFF